MDNGFWTCIKKLIWKMLVNIKGWKKNYVVGSSLLKTSFFRKKKRNNKKLQAQNYTA